MPIFSIVIGRMVNTLGYGTPEGLTAELNQTTLFFLYLAIASFVVCYLEVGMWMLTGRITFSCTTQTDSILHTPACDSDGEQHLTAQESLLARKYACEESPGLFIVWTGGSFLGICISTQCSMCQCAAPLQGQPHS